MDNNKVSTEELKKLEDEAYFELCQIIAEALQLQDVELLDARIYNWKNKYKKLLDGSTSNSNFKKRIEFLLTQYYSEVTQYIFKQIKFKEEKKIENQNKALSKLYKIIKETNDLDLLKKKVKEWESKYPKSAFLKMYQKKVDLYTSEKYLKDNALNQKEAFEDWCSKIKKNLTFDEFKVELADWSKLYSIGDKYNLDDFIKNQTEIKRYTSDEYLNSISREDPITENEKENIASKNVSETKNHAIYSNKLEQEAAYSALVSISKKTDNVNEMFKWVYKNSSINFDNRYKELILNATHFDYSPTYLNKLQIPQINLNKNSLSYEEYLKMDEIKRYAIISYFNLLLPHDSTISNKYFNSCINTIYAKLQEKKYVDNSSDKLEQEILTTNIEIVLSQEDSKSNIEMDLPQENIKDNIELELPQENSKDDIELKLPLEDSKNNIEINLHQENIKDDIDLELPQKNSKDDIELKLPKEDSKSNIEIDLHQENIKDDIELELPKENSKNDIELKLPLEDSKSNIEINLHQENMKDDIVLDLPKENLGNISENSQKEPQNIDLQPEKNIAVSPLLFSLIDYKAKQAVAIDVISEHVDERTKTNNYIEKNSNLYTKQKYD